MRAVHALITVLENVAADVCAQVSASSAVGKNDDCTAAHRNLRNLVAFLALSFERVNVHLLNRGQVDLEEVVGDELHALLAGAVDRLLVELPLRHTFTAARHVAPVRSKTVGIRHGILVLPDNLLCKQQLALSISA